ncbi:MAG: hypothetical protein AAF738_09085, partial [Bacteroidota bacterium]
MNAITFFSWLIAMIATNYHQLNTVDNTLPPTPVANFTESNACTSSFEGEVTTHKIYDGYSEVGHSIWMSRKTQRLKAKYFAHKQDDNNGGTKYVHSRYGDWRGGKYVVLKSSGAYASGWKGSDVPVGITVDNGIVVNRSYYNKMDGLVIVYATGGIAVSNIEDGNLYLDALGKR